MTFGSLFSGCGLMDLGIESAGLKCLFQCEIDPDARRVLAHHWPNVPCHEDVRTVGKHNLPRVDVLVGCFPCQSVSLAGQRAGLADKDKTGLFYEMARIAYELQPKFVLAENVPGLLSSDSGRDFGRLFLEMDKRGFRGCAWRILDAQFYGVPQRRRRVFLCWVRNDLRAGCAAQILALADSRKRCPPQSGKSGANIAATLRSRSASAGVNRPGRGGEDDQNLMARDVVVSLDAHMGMCGMDDNAARPIPIQEINARTGRSSTDPRYGVAVGNAGDPMFSLQARHQHGVAVAPSKTARQQKGGFTDPANDGLVAYNIVGLGQQGKNHAYEAKVTGAIAANGESETKGGAGVMMVRRLTPI